MENGSRKKFDGVVWRTICSIPGCFIAAQRNELCRKHFIKLNGKPNTAPTMAMSMIGSGSMVIPRQNSTSSIDDRLGMQFSVIWSLPGFSLITERDKVHTYRIIKDLAFFHLIIHSLYDSFLS